MSIETFENQEKDSNMIITQVMNAEFDTIDEVKQLITQVYVPDMTISRAGISHALKLLEAHFEEKRFYREEVK